MTALTTAKELIDDDAMIAAREYKRALIELVAEHEALILKYAILCEAVKGFYGDLSAGLESLN